MCAVKPEKGGGSCKRDAVLTCAGLGDNAVLAHEFCQKPFAHAVIELVRTGVIQILALEINLAVAEFAAEIFAVINGRGTTLKLAANINCDE